MLCVLVSLIPLNIWFDYYHPGAVLLDIIIVLVLSSDITILNVMLDEPAITTYVQLPINSRDRAYSSHWEFV